MRIKSKYNTMIILSLQNNISYFKTYPNFVAIWDVSYETVNDNAFKHLTCSRKKCILSTMTIFSMQNKPVWFNNILKF